MKIPSIRPCSSKEFNKLSQKEQFKYKVSGLIRENLGQEYGIWTEPKTKEQAYGNFWARISNAIKNLEKNFSK